MYIFKIERKNKHSINGATGFLVVMSMVVLLFPLRFLFSFWTDPSLVKARTWFLRKIAVFWKMEADADAFGVLTMARWLEVIYQNSTEAYIIRQHGIFFMVQKQITCFLSFRTFLNVSLRESQQLICGNFQSYQ